jgi:hypothetical protein
MENVRIIQLSPNTFISNVSSFEEVFDEYSEARGDRRAKRTARKVERQQAKAEVQRAKGEAKAARQMRKTDVANLRQDRRTGKVAARQDRRTARTEMAQTRRTGRSEMRQGRKAGRSQAIQERRTDRRASAIDRRRMGEELEPQLEDEIIDDGGYVDNQGEYVPQGGGAYEGESTQEEQGYVPQGGGAYEGESYQEEEQYDNMPQDKRFYEEDEFYQENDSEVSPNGYDFGDEYDSYINDEPENDFNFDGNVDNSDDMFDVEQASQVITIPEAITVTADCIEWNKELYSRLDGKKKEILANEKTANTNVKPYDEAMQKASNRIAELEEYLSGWGDCKYNYTSSNQFEPFPTMDTDFSNAEGQVKMERVKRGRAKRIKKAKELARKKREQITIVKSKLNPIIKSNEIVVPASSFEGIPQGTGLIGLDDNNDYDAPEELDIELTSNASGDVKKINTNAILLGVGIALVGIWAIRKYKLIK